MLIVRQAQAQDLDSIYALAVMSGTGLTTLPANKSVLSAKIETSLSSFNKKLSAPVNEYYLWVLEDINTKRVVGTAAIEAKVGYQLPFYSYRICKESSISHELNIRNELEFLTLVSDYQGKTEISSLFLDPQYRNKHNGSLLSRSRFIFMAQFPERFTDVVFAELRGVSNEQGESPFWDSLAKHFFHMEFKQADLLTMTSNKQFIADLMPRMPIYTLLLSQHARDVIAKPHVATMPAYKLLTKEGFLFRGCIDIFDAGPTVEAPFSQIVTLNQTQVFCVTEIRTTMDSPDYIIGTTTLDYKAVLGHLISFDDNTCILNQSVALVLGVTVGDTIRVSKIS